MGLGKTLTMISLVLKSNEEKENTEDSDEVSDEDSDDSSDHGERSTWLSKASRPKCKYT